MSTPDAITNNPVHVAFCSGVVIGAAGLLMLGKLTGAETVSLVPWTTAILVLGHPVGIVAAGFSVSAHAKAAQILQAIKGQLS